MFTLLRNHVWWRHVVRCGVGSLLHSIIVLLVLDCVVMGHGADCVTCAVHGGCCWACLCLTVIAGQLPPSLCPPLFHQYSEIGRLLGHGGSQLTRGKRLLITHRTCEPTVYLSTGLKNLPSGRPRGEWTSCLWWRQGWPSWRMPCSERTPCRLSRRGYCVALLAGSRARPARQTHSRGQYIDQLER